MMNQLFVGGGGSLRAGDSGLHRATQWSFRGIPEYERVASVDEAVLTIFPAGGDLQLQVRFRRGCHS